MSSIYREHDPRERCGICQDTNIIQPRELPCSHFFCFGCLSDYISHELQNHRENYLICPICRQQIPIPVTHVIPEEVVGIFPRKVLTARTRRPNNTDYQNKFRRLRNEYDREVSKLENITSDSKRGEMTQVTKAKIMSRIDDYESKLNSFYNKAQRDIDNWRQQIRCCGNLNFQPLEDLLQDTKTYRDECRYRNNTIDATVVERYQESENTLQTLRTRYIDWTIKQRANEKSIFQPNRRLLKIFRHDYNIGTLNTDMFQQRNLPELRPLFPQNGYV